ncbi:MAG TPA: hypothetical protein VKA86_18450 [Candidatus Krumholzibacteria bacterium]|nr:hypothetical protein [Candidatus Krumholzibacteria bacterium]
MHDCDDDHPLLPHAMENEVGKTPEGFVDRHVGIFVMGHLVEPSVEFLDLGGSERHGMPVAGEGCPTTPR